MSLDERDEILRQLEYFKDIGIDSLDVPAQKKQPAPSKPSAARPAAAARAQAISVSAPEPKPAPVQAPPSLIQVQDGDTLDSIRADIGDCRRCKLCEGRTNIVFGSGNSRAELVFVGEAPGFDEDKQGLPFVGRAGQLLTKIIESINIRREDVYICNVLKCRPPDNRNPEPDEVSACNPFLKRQLAVIRPKVVCCLGTFAAHTVMQTTAPISKLRGGFRDIDGMRVIATFHPAYLLRSPERKRDVWEDMKQIRTELIRLQ